MGNKEANTLKSPRHLGGFVGSNILSCLKKVYTLTLDVLKNHVDPVVTF